MARKDNRINLMAEGELLENAKALAFMEGISLSELICTLLQRHIDVNRDLLEKYYSIQKQIRRAE